MREDGRILRTLVVVERSQGEERGKVISERTFALALVAYLVAAVGYFHFFVFHDDRVWRVARAIAAVGAVAHLVSIVARGIAADRVPWGNMYEYSSLLSLLVVVAYLFGVEGKGHIRTLGGFFLAFAVLTMGLAASNFYVAPGPLVPALNSYWIKIHVVAAILGSALLTIGAGVLTSLFLLQHRRERRGRSPDMPPIMGGAVDVLEKTPPIADEIDSTERSAASGEQHGLLPPAATLDRLAYGMIAFGFPIWTFAVIAGAIWAQEAWGRYWGWDPKEVWSFVTWVIFAGYLHARATSGWKGTRAAVIALVGFLSLIVTYYVVNLWIAGLHSYKGF